MNTDDPGIGVERAINEIQQAASALRVDVPVVRVKGQDYETAFATYGASDTETYRQVAAYIDAVL